MADALFPEPNPIPHALSAMYTTQEYRASATRKPTWTASPKGTMYCDECFAEQHENRHQLQRTRAKANKRRTFIGGPDLMLCGPHAQLWRERDQDDGK